jgi:hypothetical protein
MRMSPRFLASSTAIKQRVQRDPHPALFGLQVSWGLRQSMPSNIYAICAAEIDTTPSFADGHTNFPRSSRLA